MRTCILIFMLGFFPSLFGQIHNRLLKVNVGVSTEQFDMKNLINTYNDTSSHKFEYVSNSPSISYTHEFVLSEILSVSGKIGYQYLNVFYDHQHYGSSLLYLSVNPQLSLFYRGRFEYYIKLQAGIEYWLNKPELLPGITRRFFPEGVNFFTGVTLGGFNYYMTDKLGLNLELSVWSPEFVTFGVSYRFFKGEIPSIQELQDI